jgi:hypothetical protein
MRRAQAAPMSDFDKLRDQLDELRGRVVMLELGQEANISTSVQAHAVADAAERQLVKTQSEWREVVDDLEAGMSQIISLLSAPDACLPARRPENTQSASDSPLT